MSNTKNGYTVKKHINLSKDKNVSDFPINTCNKRNQQ